MSGLEIAGLTLPLLIETIKTYRLVYEKVHTYRNWSKEVERIRARFLTQREFFLNECHLLLLDAVDDDASAKAMLEDLSHSNWSDPNLIGRVDERLSKNRKLGLLIIQSTREALEEIRLELQPFDQISENRIAVGISPISFVLSSLHVLTILPLGRALYRNGSARATSY